MLSIYHRTTVAVVLLLVVISTVPPPVTASPEFSGSGSGGSATAGETITITFTVRNVGTEDDAAVLDVGSLPSGWSVTDHGGDANSFKLSTKEFVWFSIDQGDVGEATLTLDTPSNTPTCEYTIPAVIKDSNNKIDDSINVDVTIKGESAGSSRPTSPDAIAQSGTTFWRGQWLFFNGSKIINSSKDENSAQRSFQLHKAVGNNQNQIGQLVNEFTVDSDGRTLLNTNCLDGDYVVTYQDQVVHINDNGTGTISSDSTSSVSSAALEIQSQSFTAGVDEDDVPVRPGESATIEVDSNRASYLLNISASELDVSNLEDIFNYSNTDNNIAYVDKNTDTIGLRINGDESIEANFTRFGSDAQYNFNLEVTDTTARNTLSIHLNESKVNMRFADNRIFTDQEGDKVDITIKMTDGEKAWIFIGNKEVNFLERVAIEDNNNDGTVTLTMNTFLVHRQTKAAYEISDGDTLEGMTQFSGASASNHQSLSKLVIDPQTAISDPIDPDEYLLRVASTPGIKVINGKSIVVARQDTGVIDLNQRETIDIRTWVRPSGRSVANDLDDVEDILLNATESRSVALTDRLIIQVRASGLYGYLQDELISTLFKNGLEMQVKQSNPPPNAPPAGIDLTGDGTQLYVDAADNTFFVVIDLRNIDTINQRQLQGGQIHNITFSLYGGGSKLPEFPDGRSDSNPYVDQDATEIVQSRISFEEPDVDLVRSSNDTFRVPVQDDVVVRGTTNLAPSSTLTVQLRSTGSNPFRYTRDVTVEKTGTFSVSFGALSIPAGTEFDIIIKKKGEKLLSTNAVATNRVQRSTLTPTSTSSTPTPVIETITVTQTPRSTSSPQQITQTVVQTRVVTRTVVKTPTETPGQPGFGVTVAIVALLAAALLGLCRRD